MPENKDREPEYQHRIEELKVYADLAKTLSQDSKVYLIGTVMGISVGAIFCVAGFTLAILGLTGNIEWIFEAANLKSRLTNASPGALFALMGMIIIWRYKPQIRNQTELAPRKRELPRPSDEDPYDDFITFRHTGSQ